MMQNKEDKDNTLWEYYGITKTGLRHQEKNLLCQDRVSYKENGHRQAIALVDGIGQTNKNVLAGDQIAEYLTDIMVSQFDKIMEQEQVEMNRWLLKDIYRIIENLMQEFSMPKEEFASTIAVIGLDHDRNAYCALHLGDGIIITMNDEIEVISYPENGFCTNQTYLTISENALQKLRRSKGQIDNKTEFAIISDGAYRMSDLHEMLIPLINSEEFYLETEDDRGFVRLKKAN